MRFVDLTLRRAIAFLVDAALVVSAWLVIAAVVTFADVQWGEAANIVLLAATFAYFGLLDRHAAGTIGKRLLGVRILRHQGGRIDALQSFGRALIVVFLVAWIPTILLLIAQLLRLSGSTASVVDKVGFWFGIIALPASIVVGNGAFGFHDMILRTRAVRRRRVLSDRRLAVPRHYWPKFAGVLCLLAVPLTATYERILNPITRVAEDPESVLSFDGMLLDEFVLGQLADSNRRYLEGGPARTFFGTTSRWRFENTEYEPYQHRLPEHLRNGDHRARGVVTYDIAASFPGIRSDEFVDTLSQRIATLIFRRFRKDIVGWAFVFDYTAERRVGSCSAGGRVSRAGMWVDDPAASTAYFALMVPVRASTIVTACDTRGISWERH